MKSKVRLCVYPLLLGLLVACEGSSLRPLEKLKLTAHIEKYATAEIHFQSNASVLVYGAMLFLPIVDHSGSNYVDPYTTDPLATRRYDPLIEVCEELQAQNNSKIYSGLITFGEHSFVQQSISNQMGNVCDTLRTQRAERENLGWTNYLSAIQNAHAQLSAFLDSHANDNQRYKIAVAFITDGDPKVASADNTTTVIQDSNLIRSRVRALRDMVLSHGSIVEEFRFHTAYYDRAGNRSSTAATLLSNMAKDGLGSYVEFISGETLDLNAFLPAKLVRSYHVDQPWVIGEGIWERDETGELIYSADSDMDGLSDRQEQALGCSTTSRDTNGNGIGDLVEVRLYADCKRARPLVCLYPSTKDSDGDGLNDCEEGLLNERLQFSLDRFNPISSDSKLPDLIAFSHNLFSSGGVLGDPDLDGVSTGRELSQWLPPLFPNSELDFRGIQQSVQEVGRQENGVRDFEWTIRSIPLARANGDDLIRVFVPQYLDGSLTPIMKSAEKRIRDGHVQFGLDDFR